MKKFSAIMLLLAVAGCGHNVVTMGRGFGITVFSAVIKDNSETVFTGETESVSLKTGDQTTGYETSVAAGGRQGEQAD